YIEVHHLKPLSQTDEEHEVTADDLVPLCANCHAIAHRRSPEPFTPDEIKAMIQKNLEFKI
ncbi:MAG: HNH endonuclease, partial [Muribaculum sp.]|nr:HNH endonuclease [Muribaculum sp.]